MPLVLRFVYKFDAKYYHFLHILIAVSYNKDQSLLLVTHFRPSGGLDTEQLVNLFEVKPEKLSSLALIFLISCQLLFLEICINIPQFITAEAAQLNILDTGDTG